LILDETVRGEVAIVGIGEAIHASASRRSREAMAFDAISAALTDAGIAPEDVDGIMVTGHYDRQVTPDLFRAYFRTQQDIWFSGAGGAMTYAATAPYHAALNVFAVDWATEMARKDGPGPAAFHLEDATKANVEVPFGFIPQPVYFAHIARRHMFEFGTRPEHLGAIAVAQRRHAVAHPEALMRHKPLSLEGYLAREPFIDPLRLDDCCLISDAAAAFVMVAGDCAVDLPQLPIFVAGVGYAKSEAGPFFAQEPDFMSTPQRRSAPAAFAMAGIGPRDVDVLANYDPFSVASLIQIEDMGFCPKGEGGGFVDGDRLAFDRGRRRGGLPYNTHGGLLSHAYVLGISHVVELVRQLRGSAANQVRDAQVAVYGGYTGLDTGTLVLTREAWR
jgi:acetyl-CoA acetyltransferase